MKTDIWFPLVIGDFLKFARNLTPVERGAWLNITIEMWLQDGWINTSWAGLARYSGLPDAEWQITCQVISGLRLGSAQVFREDEGGITQDWLLDELDKAKKRKLVSKSNGMKGGRPRQEPAGLPAGFAAGNLEHNLEITSSPSPSHKEKEREALPRQPRERKPVEFAASPESMAVFQVWKLTFPNDDAPRIQTCKNIMGRLRQNSPEQLVFCILKYANLVKKEIESKPDGKVMTYKGSNFFGEKAYFETYTPTKEQIGRADVLEKVQGLLGRFLPVTAPSSPGTAGTLVPPPTESTQSPEVQK